MCLRRLWNNTDIWLTIDQIHNYKTIYNRVDVNQVSWLIAAGNYRPAFSTYLFCGGPWE